MSGLRLSVVVVSQGRPAALCRCLTGLSQQWATDIELVVVADAEGLAAIRRLPNVNRIKMAQQAQPNISQARNTGLSLAAGEVVAFVDDDAVAVPSWAQSVVAAFRENARLGAATGPVLGRNGISLQWGDTAVDALGRDQAGDDPNTKNTGDSWRKLHGTNMALRRTALEQVGGFDPAFAFFLDDTDLAVRIGRAGIETQWLPGAVVHHGFAASARRTADRVPLSLHDIGASTAVFLRKHAPGADHDLELDRLTADQRARLLRLARRRRLDAGQTRALMESLRDGIAEGRDRGFGHDPVAGPNTGFQRLRDAPPLSHVVLSGWRHQAGRLRADAASRVIEGHVVSLFLFEPTPRKHSVTFTDGGWWEQVGGLYGPSDRSAPRLQAWTRNKRLQAEIDRIARERRQH